MLTLVFNVAGGFAFFAIAAWPHKRKYCCHKEKQRLRGCSASARGVKKIFTKAHMRQV
jgi:hypothetical protein